MPAPSQRLRRLLADSRILLLLGLVYLVLSLATPYFLTLRNQTTILKGMSFALPAAIGMTLVMICGQLDLTIGTNLSLGGVLALGLAPRLGWSGALAAALAGGAAVGCLNGLLVARARIDSFIATLGMMIVSQGLIYILTHGNTVASADFALGHWMEARWPLLPPRVIVAVALALVFEFLMKRTRPGRNLFLIGGNRMTAWTSGVAVERHVIGAFMVSGTLACLGGALFSIGIGSATPTQGDGALMEVIAAVIIGGTAMSGGRGSVFKSMAALLTLTALYNGLECLGAGWEIRRITGGAVLGAVVLYDALLAARHRRVQGRRHELLAELKIPFENKYGTLAPEEGEEDGSEMMQPKQDKTLAIVVVGCVACVAIVAIFAMFFLSLRGGAGGAATGVPMIQAAPAPAPANGGTAENAGTTSSMSRAARAAAEAGRAIAQVRQAAGRERRELTPQEEEQIVALLRSDDGQPLILPSEPKRIPPRPELPQESYPEDDARHWYDMEYAGWGATKVNLPQPPAGGPRGKRVLYLKAIDHPYQTAMTRGMRKIADVYGIKLEIKTADGTPPRQDQQVDQAINEHPDLVIISPVEAKSSVSMLKRLNEAGIPVIAINLLPEQEGHKYILAWTGPDDWGQFRLLAHEFARQMGNRGNYAIVQHRPGWSPFFGRTYAVTTELKQIAPEMKCLQMQTTMLDAEKSRDVVSGWLTQYGRELKGIVSCDDSGCMVGINQAVKDAGREDILRISAGNSKVGMDFVKEGRLQASTYQSAEADGAIPMKMAADWFYGKPVPPIRYLPLHIITQQDVDQFMPAQW